MLFVAALALAAPSVSIQSVLPQMADLGWLCKEPNPRFVLKQASSYDRASTSLEKADTWFANADYGQYVRSEDHSGRAEFVMIDADGPGCVVRIWSANPHGRLRFYFDDSDKPAYNPKMADLLEGREPLFPSPFAYNASYGRNLYFPIPFAKHLKVTVDESDGPVNNLYYHFGYRAYSAGTEIRTFALDDVREQKKAISKCADQLNKPKDAPGSAMKRTLIVAPAKEAVVYEGDGKNAITEFSVTYDGLPLLSQALMDAPDLPWADARRLHNVLRSVIVKMEFDGELCVECPLGDFFGSAPGVNPFQTLPFEVDSDGTMTSHWVMPFGKSARISLLNTGPQTPEFTCVVRQTGFPFDAHTYHFKAGWTHDRGSTRPMRDMAMLHTEGNGMLVGSSLAIANPTGAWWGEGDEKISVDGEAFPSIFGTGTEDFYGYAWSSPDLFGRPYHSQSRCDGPANRGHSSVNRFFIADPIPFTKSLKFDLEMWHWAEVEAEFDRVTYWYALPGGAAPPKIDPASLPVMEIAKPAPIPGAVEGESMKIMLKDGGEVENQGGFYETSGFSQLWWKEANPGQKLLLEFEVPEAGRYAVSGNFCHNVDYGRHRLQIGSQPAIDLDFFSTTLGWTKVLLGTYDLPKGPARLTVTCLEPNKQAKPGQMFGLDYLLLEKK